MQEELWMHLFAKGDDDEETDDEDDADDEGDEESW